MRTRPAGARHADTARARTKVLLAFAAIYFIWGSTYLGIHYAIETIPPLLMAGARFLAAGGLLYVWARGRGAPRPAGARWRDALVVGGLLFLGGNGALVWAQQRVPSGVAAVLVATVPVWMVLLAWLWRGGTRPGGRVLLGLVLGLAGIVLLVGPGRLAGSSRVDPLGALVLVAGSLSWAAGSLHPAGRRLPTSRFLAPAMQLLAGGLLLLVAGTLRGELGAFGVSDVSARSLVAFAYLIGFGSIIAFSAYVWLLRVSAPARVATYAFVNPIVAVLLGWAVAGEALSLRIGAAAAVVVAAVVLVTTGAPPAAPAPAEGEPTTVR